MAYFSPIYAEIAAHLSSQRGAVGIHISMRVTAGLEQGEVKSKPL